MHRETIRDNDITLSETLKISTGWYHSCAIVTGGVLKCWGGTAGLGSEVSSPTVVDAGTSYADVAVGAFHSCAITVSGVLKCWGPNNYGETGNTYSTTPHDMDNTDTYSSVAAGYQTTCAISTTNQLKCWGYLSTSGALPQQTAVVVGSNFQKVSIGTSHACALKSDGTVYCWGNNDYGQIGDGTNAIRREPNVAVPGTYTDISVGLLSSCAIKTDTSISCWGVVGFYTGSSTARLSNTPYSLTGADGYVKIRVLPKYADNVDAKCAIKSNGDVFCSGALNSDLTGYAINTTWTDSFVKFFSPASELTFGRGFGCSVYQGLTYCFGSGAGSALGLGYSASEEAYFATPQEGPNVVTMTRPDANRNSSCGIDSSSRLRCWGSHTGELNSTNLQSYFNRPHSYILDTGTTYSAVVGKATATWLNYFCGITTAGALKCWTGDTGQPTALDTSTTYSSQIEIFAGNGCAISASGQLKCWGDNSTACMVGIGCGQASTNTPTLIDSGTSYAILGHGENYSRAYMCAITTTGSLKCWGNTIATGSHHYGSTSIDPTPTLIDMGTQYSGVELGNTHACGITTTGTLKCWSGMNGSGELGTGDYSGHDTPQVINSGTNYLSVSIANYTTCAITSTNVLQCWGLNSTYGRVGQGTTTTDYPSPQVVDSGISYSKVQVGTNSVCAITTAGVLKCWGANIGLGNRNTSYFLSPVIINAGTTYSDVWVDNGSSAKTICARTVGGITQCWGTNSYLHDNLGINFSESLPFNRPLGLE